METFNTFRERRLLQPFFFVALGLLMWAGCGWCCYQLGVDRGVSIGVHNTTIADRFVMQGWSDTATVLRENLAACEDAPPTLIVRVR